MHAQAPESTPLADDAGPFHHAQAREGLFRQSPLLVGEVVDQVRARPVVLADVVVVDGLLDETTRGHQIVDRCSGGVGPLEEGLAIDFAQHLAVALGSRIRPDHLQIENDASGPDRVHHVAQDVHDVLRLHSSE
jgi:hypothetical protein